MYIYLFFIFLGILLYILLNNYNTFSVGIPTYNIQNINPSVVFSPAPEFTGNTVTDATVIINGQRLSLREYIESQDDSDFPGDYNDYFLAIDSPEVDEEGEPPCRVEEGMPAQIDCYRAQLLTLGIDGILTDYIISQVEKSSLYVKESELNLSEMKLRLACATNQRLANNSPLFTNKNMDAHLLHSIAIELDEISREQLWGNYELGFGLDSYTDHNFYEYIDMNILLRILEIFQSPVDLPDNLNPIQLMNNFTPIIIQLLRLGLNYTQIIDLLNIHSFDELERILNINFNEQIDYDGIEKLTLYYYIYHISVLTSVLTVEELNSMTIDDLLSTFDEIISEQYESSDGEDDVELFSDQTGR